MQREIERLQKARRRDLTYGMTWTPPDSGIDLDAVLADLNGTGGFDLEAEVAALAKEAPPPAAPAKSAYALDDDDDFDYKLDDDDDGDRLGGAGGPKGIGAARNEELLRRQLELKALMDERNAVAALTSSASVALTSAELDTI
jgi:hypothetical protein